MTDIAQIGFRVDTTELEKAAARLDALVPAAAGAASGAQKLQSTVQGASSAIQNAAVAVAKAEASKAEAILAAARASGTASRADIQAAVAAKRHADASLAVARAERDRVAAMNAAAGASKRTEAAAIAAAAALKEQSMASRNAFNAASGARSPGGGPTPANDQLPNRFNTANIAAQFQDIGVTAAMGMNPMLIALQQGTQLSAIINTMESPLKGIQIALASVFNTLSLGTIAIVGLVAAGLQMIDWASTAQSIMYGLASAVETVGPYVVALAGALALLYAPAAIAGLQAVALWIGRTGLAALTAGAQMATAWFMALGPVGLVIAGITAVVVAMNIFRDELARIFGVDVVNAIKDAVNKAIGFFVGLFEGIVSAAKNLPAQLRGEGMSAGDAFAEGFARAMERDYIGTVADGVVNAASSAADKIRQFAGTIGQDTKKKRGKTDAEKYEDIVNGANRAIESMKAEQQALLLTSVAAAKLKYETDLLNDARQKGIDLTPVQREQLSALAQTMAETGEKTRLMKDFLDGAKDATSGFFSDMRSNLQQGQSLWESFGNAVGGVLDRILDKLLDFGVDQLFNFLGGFGEKAGGGGGLIGKALGFLFNAKGNAFTSSGVEEFAKGGAFTNSVVSRPTMFKFAKGGSFSNGVMGEAGPEAVMPLSRAPDGSLGVQAVGGGGGGGDVFVEVVVNGNADVQQERQTLNDGTELRRFIINTVNEANANGDLDSSNGGRYGLAPRKVVR